MKSIWLEANGAVDAIWPKLLKDYGIPNEHEFFVNCTEIPKNVLIGQILDAEQICFFSSFVSGMKSFELIEDLLEYFSKTKLTGKRIISCDYLLDSLKPYGKIDESERFAELFDNNLIGEMNEGVISRIQFVNGKYQYTETICSGKYN